MKIKYLVPNFFTTCSLVSGIFALKYALDHNYVISGWLIALSLICDGLDGKLARILNASSLFGKVFDTISDFFAFGIVPAVLAYICVLHKFGTRGIIVAILYILCGAFRLTRFMRKSSEPEKKKPFTGLPIPAAAGFTASFLILNYHLWQQVLNPTIFPFLMLFIAFLMISRIEYIPLDPKMIKNNFLLIFIIITGLIIFILYPYYTYNFTISFYILYGLIVNFLPAK